MIVIYLLDYGTKNPCKADGQALSVSSRGVFDDSQAQQSHTAAQNLAWDVLKIPGPCPFPAILPQRYLVSVVWYSDVTAHRRATLYVADNGYRIRRMYGPGPSDDNDWPPALDRTVLQPVGVTEENTGGASLATFVPPEVPGDVVYEEEGAVRWWTVIGVGAIIALGVGSYVITGKMMERSRG